MYYVYVLQSQSDNAIYIGFTSDLVTRLSVHNAGQSEYTKKHIPLKLVYYEAYLVEQKARLRELKLKQHGSVKQKLLKRIFED